MSKKDFIRLAEYLRDNTGWCEPYTDRQIEHIADFCYEADYAFGRTRWIGYIKGTHDRNGKVTGKRG